MDLANKTAIAGIIIGIAVGGLAMAIPLASPGLAPAFWQGMSVLSSIVLTASLVYLIHLHLSGWRKMTGIFLIFSGIAMIVGGVFIFFRPWPSRPESPNLDYTIGFELSHATLPSHLRENSRIYTYQIVNPGMPLGIGSFASGTRQINWGGNHAIGVLKFKFVNYRQEPIINLHTKLTIIYYQPITQDNGVKSGDEVARNTLVVPNTDLSPANSSRFE